MNKLCKGILFSSIFILVGNVYAGVIVGGTRVVYDGAKREASLSVKNPDATAYLIQAWADADGVAGNNTGAAKPPFVVTPPLFRLDAGNENLVRIIRTGGTLPEDRESIYWMNVKSIPASEKSDKNVLQISVKTRIKLFYRPAGLKGPSEEDYKQITFHRTGKQLTVTNPTPYYLSFFELKLGSTPVTTTDIVVPPKGSADYPLSTSAAGSQVTWKVINDYGGSSKPVTSEVK
ncbi:molecular chaperone [Kluyvera sichuanensis]|uniref:fimbrial biogenesis chaperone n=1 Tax=Kluyvera sichuanensis TaxID=2725494 RepID=UPI0039F4C78E